MYSPAAMAGAAPSTVTRSRCPRALMRRTQKPLSALWKVTRSTKPANGSRSLDEPDPEVSIQICFEPRAHLVPTHHTRLRFCDVEYSALLGEAFHSQSRRHPINLT